ncbi:MAG: hypothetical protein GY771_05350 [bacterium]|nr:hypothetical protein [bacterium]
MATTTPGDTASDLLSTPFRDDGAPKIDIPMVGDIGPVLYRGMWIAIAIVATIIAVNLITKGFLLKTGVKLATKGVV